MANASGTGPSERRLVLLPPPGTRRTERIEIVLAEKRTALSLMRTGVVVLALPFAVLTTLVVASSYYLSTDRVWLAAMPLIVLCLGLVGFGIFLLAQGFSQARRLDHQLDSLKDKSSHLAEGVHQNG